MFNLNSDYGGGDYIGYKQIVVYDNGMAQISSCMFENYLNDYNSEKSKI